MERFRDRYRVASARLPFYDYGSAGWYHVVICTKRRRPWFGRVHNAEVVLSTLGRIALGQCAEIPLHVDRAVLDAFVVMPDHVHLIVGLLEIDDAGAGPNRFGPLVGGSLPAVVHGYKSSVTRWARQSGYAGFAWQPRYFERVIRNVRELERTRGYVVGNPMRQAAHGARPPLGELRVPPTDA